ncbi:MAG TPA: hypothetical protein VE487_07955 [Ilumatobacter sp.]|jgi:hypothetical protein|nr:hypothetical protein [Ilumatobacter sp.]
MTTRITIHHNDLGDGVVAYEAREGEQLVWRGFGSSPVRGFLRLVEDMRDRDDPSVPIEIVAD